MPWTNRTIMSRLTVPMLSAAALLLACDRERPTEPPALLLDGIQDPVSQNLSLLTAQFFANEALIPDGSLTQNDPLPFGHTIHVIDRDNKGGWKIQGSSVVITFDDATCDPPQVPLPPGALHLHAIAGDEVSRLRSTRYHRTYLRDLSRLDYYACEVQPNGTQWPYTVLSIDWDGDNQINESIIFEPSYQNPAGGGACGAASDQPEPALQEWQFWDALRGTPGNPTTFKACWYSTCAVQPVPPPGCVPFLPGPTIQPLSEYIVAHPNAAIVNLDGNHGGVQITHGVTPGVGYDGWMDAFTIGKDINGESGQTLNSTITYDFQKP